MGGTRVAAWTGATVMLAAVVALLPASVAQVPDVVQRTEAPTPAPTAGPTPPPPTPQPTPPPAERTGGSGGEPPIHRGEPAHIDSGGPPERKVVYSVSEQRVWLYETGDVEAGTWLVSGRRGVPRKGSYRVFSRSRYSGNGSVHMQYMVRFARGPRWAIGFHSIPVGGRGRPIQSEAQLGTYRSHGCVRQRLADAARMWDFAQLGTLVVVK